MAWNACLFLSMLIAEKRRRSLRGGPAQVKPGTPGHRAFCSTTPSAATTMPMHMRRFTRLTNAFSKKIENHAYAVVLHVLQLRQAALDAARHPGDGRKRD
jgi:hypothetical protein